MTTVTTELHRLKVHVFESEAQREAAWNEGLIGPDDISVTPDTGQEGAGE